MENAYRKMALEGLKEKRQRLKKDIDALQEDVRQLDSFIAQMETELGEPESERPPEELKIQRGQWPGMKLREAIPLYLRQRGGTAKIKRLVSDMIVAGVLVKGFPEKNIRTSITMNKNLVVDADTDTVSLAKGPAAPKPPRRATRTQ